MDSDWLYRAQNRQGGPTEQAILEAHFPPAPPGHWEWEAAVCSRACIRLGHHPKLWKMAEGVVVLKPGKPDYSKVRAYWVISLLDVMSKLVERTATHLIADHLDASPHRLAPPPPPPAPPATPAPPAQTPHSQHRSPRPAPVFTHP